MKRTLSLIAGILLGVTASAIGNDFFNASGVPSTGAALVSSTIRGEFANIGAGFDKLPSMTGNGNKIVTVNAGGTALTSSSLDTAIGLTPTGMVVHSAANTLIARSVTGTTNQITVTNGDGVAGAPTLSFPATVDLTGSTVTTVTQSAGDSSTKVATTSFVSTAVTNGLPSGTVLDFAGTAAPSGYLLCDGSAVSRTGANAALFAAIGTTWGAGNGSTTFNVPDFRRRATVGSGGAGTGTLGNAVGNTGGEETHTMTSGELVAHAHTQQGTFTSGGQSASHTHGNFEGINRFTSQGTGARDGTVGNGPDGATGAMGGASNDHTHNTTISGSTTSTGSTTPFNQLQPSAVVLKIIKL